MFAKKKSSFSKRRSKSNMRFYITMMAIPVLQFCVMWFGVNINSILLAFKEYSADMSEYVWTLANFKAVIKDLGTNQQVQTALRNSVYFWLITNVITFPTSFVFSYYFYRNYKFSRVIKTMMFMPSVISGPVMSIVIYQLMDRGYPLIMKTLFGKDVMGLLANSETTLIALICYMLFFGLGGNFIFLSSAMSGIDPAISEAARCDGASVWQEFRYITFPMIYPTVSIFFVTSLVGIFTGDYGMYSFYKVCGTTAAETMGLYFTRGLTEWGMRRYPYFAAFGLVLTVLSCLVVFPGRAYVNSKNPMRDIDEAKLTKKRLRKEARRRV